MRLRSLDWWSPSAGGLPSPLSGPPRRWALPVGRSSWMPGRVAEGGLATPAGEVPAGRQAVSGMSDEKLTLLSCMLPDRSRPSLPSLLEGLDPGRDFVPSLMPHRDAKLKDGRGSSLRSSPPLDAGLKRPRSPDPAACMGCRAFSPTTLLPRLPRLEPWLDGRHAPISLAHAR